MLDYGLVGCSGGVVEWGVPVGGAGWFIVGVVQWGVPVVIVQW